MKTITGREDDHFRDRGRGRVRVRVRGRGRGRGRGRNRSRGLDQITTGQSHADLGLDLGLLVGDPRDPGIEMLSLVSRTT